MKLSIARSLNTSDDEYRSEEECVFTAGAGIKSSGDNMTRGRAGAASKYDPNNAQQLIALLATIYTDLCAVRDEPEVLAYYAGFSCKIAVFVREHCQVDMGNLTFPIEASPLAASHPVMMALPALDVWIEDYFNSLATAAASVSELGPNEKMQRLATQARMRAACMWKGYLFALNTQPANWGIDAVCALSALAILSTADPAKVIGALRDGTKAAMIRDNVRDDDWPPRAFIDLYLRNDDLLANKMQALLPQV
jgi:hypothetical protein